MRYKLLLIIGFLTLLSLSMISAEIMLSQPASIYNLGDILQLKATIKPSQQANGFFEINLFCENNTINLHREYLSMTANSEKTIDKSILLEKSYLEDIKGICKISSTFSNEKEESQEFTISDKINIILSISNLSIAAGEKLSIKGDAVKENGKKVEGFAVVSLSNESIKSEGKVTNGVFDLSFSFPETTKAGDYNLIIKAYEESSGIKTNIGETSVNINVKRVPSKIEIESMKLSVKPGESFSFIPVIYDQANEKIDGEISVKILTPFNKLFSQKILKSGEEYKISLLTNADEGYWSIEASSLNLNNKKLVYVEKMQKAAFSIANNTLTIENIGNVIYEKSVQISIGDTTDIKKVSLDVGEKKIYRLSAPEGAYNLEVTDGEEQLKLADVALTGKVISISESEKRLFGSIKYTIVWFFLIAVFGVFIFLSVKKLVTKKNSGYSVESLEKAQNKIMGIKDLTNPNENLPQKAEHTLVLDGRKENVGVIAIRIKDLNNIKQVCKDAVSEIYKTIINNKGTIYETSDNIIAIFASPITKTFDNHITAVKTARKIEDLLIKHNKMMKQKIGYGISLNSGELIVKQDNNALKFTTIGNTVTYPKMLASIAKEEILLSDSMQKNVMNEVKTERETRNGVNIYKIKFMSDREKNSKFIKGFLEREKAGK